MKNKIETLEDLLKYEAHLTQMFDSDVRVAMAVLTELRKLRGINQTKKI